MIIFGTLFLFLGTLAAARKLHDQVCNKTQKRVWQPIFYAWFENLLFPQSSSTFPFLPLPCLLCLVKCGCYFASKKTYNKSEEVNKRTNNIKFLWRNLNNPYWVFWSAYRRTECRSELLVLLASCQHQKFCHSDKTSFWLNQFWLLWSVVQIVKKCQK